MSAMDEGLEPPDATLVRQRWIKREHREWAERANEIMMEFGVVGGSETFASRETAKTHAKKLRRLMAELRIHNEWNLRMHTERKDNGWRWLLEYREDADGRAEPKHNAAA